MTFGWIWSNILLGNCIIFNEKGMKEIQEVGLSFFLLTEEVLAREKHVTHAVFSTIIYHFVLKARFVLSRVFLFYQPVFDRPRPLCPYKIKSIGQMVQYYF